MVKTHIFIDDVWKDAPLKLHKKGLKCVAVNPDCTMIATASVKGTVIKITSVDSGDVLQEVRRGTAKADIGNLICHPYLNLIAINSDKSSCHVFEIKKSIMKAVEHGDVDLDKRKNV